MTPTEKLERIVTEGMCTSCGLCQSMAGEQSVRMTVRMMETIFLSSSGN